MPNNKRNGGKPTKNKVGNSRPMVTNFGIRKVSNQNFSKVIAIPKIALANCGSPRTSKLKVELVQERGQRFIKLTPVTGGKS